MTPKIPLPSDALNQLGLPDTTGMAPTIAKASGRLRSVGARMGTVDPVTTELVRMRNARYQQCFF